MSGGLESMAEDERAAAEPEKTEHQLIHEALYFLPRGPQQTAILALMAREARYEAALRGIASCATQCGCGMVAIARKVLDENQVKWGFSKLAQDESVLGFLQSEHEAFNPQGEI